MTQTNKLTNIESIFLILTIIINHIIINLPKNLIDISGTSVIFNILYITIIMLFIIFFLNKFLKHFPGQDILDISEFLGGKFLKYAIGILFIIYFLFVASTFLRSFCESIKIIYFQRTPVIAIIALFIIGAVVCNRRGFNAIIRANLIFMPIVLFSIIFIFFANIENFNIQRMFPILGNGFDSTFLSGASNIFAFSGLSILYFLPPHLKEYKEFKIISYISIILSSICLLLSAATLLFIFPFTVTLEEIMPLYLAARFVEFGRFFQRLDAVFLLIWIISFTSYISIVLALVVNIFKKISNFKYSYITTYISAIIILILSILPKNVNQIHFLENYICKYIILIIVFGIGNLILMLANFKYKSSKKGDVSF